VSDERGVSLRLFRVWETIRLKIWYGTYAVLEGGL